MSAWSRWIVGLCLAGSVASLGYTTWLHVELDGRVEGAAYRAVRTRERELARALSPHLVAVLKDLGIEGYPKEPESFEDLVRPLLDVVKSVR